MTISVSASIVVNDTALHGRTIGEPVRSTCATKRLQCLLLGAVGVISLSGAASASTLPSNGMAAAGSGQTWASGAQPWKWNLAGVDYAVGSPTAKPLQAAYTAPSASAGSQGTSLSGAASASTLPSNGPSAAQAPGCGYPVDGGCASRPVAGSFIQTNFYAYATSMAAAGSGQTWARGAHPWNWNAAGVDYAVGYPTGRPLQDAYTARSASAGSYGVLPSACHYQAPNSPGGAPYARIYCKQYTASDIVIQGINFQSAYLGGNCVVLEVANNVTGGHTIHIIGNNFHNGPNCNWAKNNYMIKISGGTDNVDIENNQIDGTYQAYTNTNNNVAMVVANGSGNFFAQYNSILNAPQRPISTATAGTIIIQYNYINTIAKYAGEEHGELDENIISSNQLSQYYAYNTIIIPNSQDANTDTSTFYCSGGTSTAGWTINKCMVDHNVVVTNKHNGVITLDAAGLEVSYQQYNNVIFTNNYIDPSGAAVCNNNPSGSGQKLVGSISNGTMTITSIQPNSMITMGSDITGLSMLLTDYKTSERVLAGTVITRQVSGVPGGVGVYKVSGSQSLTFTNAETSGAPIWGSLQWGGNYNLVTGNAIPTGWSKPCP